ncbi:MAG: MOSC domain-containing protein [Gammaproteobacteria bacterium]|nr:MOSC domain-containing protein [Gammaproteobacteria bacterium]
MGAEWAPLPERRSALFTWLNTWRADERRGTLREIYVAGDAGAPMVSLDAVDCIDGIGLRGDRYAVGQGHWIRTDGCQVTLITTDELRHAASRGGLALEPGWHRRNLVIDGIPAAALRRSRLRIGDVVFAFHRLRPPCGYLDRVAGAGAAKALGRGGGVGLYVCGDGSIQCGDPVELLDAAGA